MRIREVDRVAPGLVEAVRADHDVLAVVLFGSHARGEENPASDTDICLVLKAGCHIDLELSRKRLQYLKSCEFDIQIFQQLPVYIRRRVLKEGKILFCRDETALYDLAFRTAQQFEDFRHIYEGYLEGVARG